MNYIRTSWECTTPPEAKYRHLLDYPKHGFLPIAKKSKVVGFECRSVRVTICTEGTQEKLPKRRRESVRPRFGSDQRIGSDGNNNGSLILYEE